jgi:hypothetical protein
MSHAEANVSYTIDAFDYVAFAVFALLLVAVLVVVVFIGKLPGQIARKRHHPQADAITVAGWIGVATGGLVWPIALIWAFLNPVSLASKLEEHRP